MTTCAEMLERVKRVNLDLAMHVALEETAGEAVAQQKLQLQQGLKSNDEYLPDYSFRSVFQYGKPPGPIRLYDTGDFYRGILFDVRQDNFIITSADSKTDMLKQRYSGDIFGHGTEARANYILTLRPVFIDQIRNYYR